MRHTRCPRRPALRRVANAGIAVLAAATLLAAAKPAPLLDPGLATDNSFFELDGVLLRARGIRTQSGDASLEFGVHVDVYDADGLMFPEDDFPELYLSLKEPLRRKLLAATPVADPVFFEWSRRWRVGEFEALHCQADDLLSLVIEVRTGRFVRDLFEFLYQLTPDEGWSRRGINLGAGFQDDGDDDPLAQWTRELAEEVLLVDGDAQSLRRAAQTLRAPGSRAELQLLNEYVTPQSLEDGPLKEAILSAVGRRVDVVKVDIDSYDCAVLQALLRSVEATVLVLESQPVVPPPFKFARQYSVGYRRGVGVHGCSLAYQLRMLHPEYMLLLYTEHDTVFVHRRVAAWLDGTRPFRWTSAALRLPIDELDCYRRARSTDTPQGDHKSVPVEFLREWALRLHPLDAFGFVAGNLTQGRELHTYASDDGRPLYTLDL